ncbi:hypothetical protein Nepgr_011580 [Nepenthes gracilis]|uniref:Uncharacterized protein n=1 Tax=Nepenthes gracilis TaxID=150966 RepID=A0AAD3SFL4_NEPGR|nr:hypothetical protein Nepgr_011580 [Nepenthes gracilis]
MAVDASGRFAAFGCEGFCPVCVHVAGCGLDFPSLHEALLLPRSGMGVLTELVSLIKKGGILAGFGLVGLLVAWQIVLAGQLVDRWKFGAPAALVHSSGMKLHYAGFGAFAACPMSNRAKDETVSDVVISKLDMVDARISSDAILNQEPEVSYLVNRCLDIDVADVQLAATQESEAPSSLGNSDDLMEPLPI